MRPEADRVVLALLEDGLYQVHAGTLCAGFVVQDGRVTDCAPILRRRLTYWMARARLVSR